VLPPLCRQYANGRYQVHFEFWPWQSGIAELVEHGQLDLVLHIDDGLLPSHFQSERLTRRTGFVPWRATAALAIGCLLSNTWPQATLLLPPMPACKQFQTSNWRLSVQNAARVFEYLLRRGPAMPSTELVLTLTRGMTSVIKNDRRLRLVKAPQELHAFHFLMAWHPRLNSDPRHVWLRTAMRSTIAALNA